MLNEGMKKSFYLKHFRLSVDLVQGFYCFHCPVLKRPSLLTFLWSAALLFLFLMQIFDISWDLYQPNKLVSCGVKHIKVMK